MKYLLIIVFGLTSSISYSQDEDRDRHCIGNYQAKVEPGDTAIHDCTMVLLNLETFAGYYHDRKSLEILREEVPDYLVVIDSLNALHEANRIDLDSINTLHSEISELYIETKEELMLDVITLSEEVVEEKRRKKRFKSIAIPSIIGNVVFVLLFLL